MIKESASVKLMRFFCCVISCFLSCYFLFCGMPFRVLFHAISRAKSFILLFPFAPIVYSIC